MCQYWPHDESEEEFGEFNVSILGKSIGDGLVRRNINIQLKVQVLHAAPSNCSVIDNNLLYLLSGSKSTECGSISGEDLASEWNS